MAKIVVVIRNPKDTLLSYYHFYQMHAGFGLFKGSWGDFFELYKNKGLSYGDWLKFYKSYWEHRSKSNVIFLAYEDMKRDVKSCIKQLASFIDVPCTEADVEEISRLVDFQHMKQNISVNRKTSKIMHKDKDFIRKGKVGS